MNNYAFVFHTENGEELYHYKYVAKVDLGNHIYRYFYDQESYQDYLNNKGNSDYDREDAAIRKRYEGKEQPLLFNTGGHSTSKIYTNASLPGSKNGINSHTSSYSYGRESKASVAIRNAVSSGEQFLKNLLKKNM